MLFVDDIYDFQYVLYDEIQLMHKYNKYSVHQCQRIHLKFLFHQNYQ